MSLTQRVERAQQAQSGEPAPPGALVPAPQPPPTSARGLTQREELLREVWGPGATESHYVRIYMGQLRHKLEADPAQPRYLLTETGVGYRLQSD